MISFSINIGTRNDLEVQVTNKNIKIIDGYRVSSKKHMKQIISEILFKAPIYNSRRSINSLVREWRTHNIIYYKGVFKNYTKDCNLSSNEPLIVRFIYWIVGRF